MINILKICYIKTKPLILKINNNKKKQDEFGQSRVVPCYRECSQIENVLSRPRQLGERLKLCALVNITRTFILSKGWLACLLILCGFKNN